MMKNLNNIFRSGTILMNNSGGLSSFLQKLLSITLHEGFSGLKLRYKYLKSAGIKEKPEVKLNLGQVLKKKTQTPPAVTAPKTTVIVPIYNGLEHLEKLCETLFECTPPGTEYIFIDDCSPDERIQTFLSASLKHRPHVRLLRNERNLGFTGTVNRAAAQVKTEYFVLLNSDVIVYENWLPRLIAPLQSGGKVASATPFSNAAVFFSFPKVGQDNRVDIDGIRPEEIDAAFARIDGTITRECEIYAGVGFCMAINTACWREIGPLDEETFGRGYSEEVDWCMRAGANGWRNVLAPNVYVQHAHGGSFSSEEKNSLSEKNLKIAHRRWPKLGEAVRNHMETNPWEAYRALAALLLADSGNGCVLVIDYAGEAGGAYAYREKLIEDLKKDDRRILLLTHSERNDDWVLTLRYLDDQYRVKLDEIDDIAQLFSLLTVKKVIVNNLTYCDQTERIIANLVSLKKAYNFYLEYKLHDYFSICPSFFLLDIGTRYCDGGLSLSRCESCAKNNKHFSIEHRDIPTWRAMWRPFLALCDDITAFSQSSLDILQKVYPLSGKTRVIEHEPLEEFPTAYIPPAREAPLVIGFMGTFVEEKGANYILELADILRDEGRNSKIVVFGPHPRIVKHPNLEFTGRYRHADIPALCNRYGVKAVVFPSPWPETFSYISQECMMLGIPFVCFDIGAPAERIRKYGYRKGVIAESFTAEALRKGVERLVG